MERKEALELLSSGDKSEVRDAIDELMRFQDCEVVERVCKRVSEMKLKAVTSVAKELLVSFKDVKDCVIDNTVELLYCDEPKVRAMAIEVIASFWNDSTTHLDRLLKSSDYNMRKYGVDILSLVPTRRSLESLVELIDDENDNVKYSAIEALSYFEAYRDRVLEILEDVFKEIDCKNTYGVISICESITKGAYVSQNLIDITREKLSTTDDKFAKHYIYKLLLSLGVLDMIDDARLNAKSINLLSDWEKEEKFYLSKGA